MTVTLKLDLACCQCPLCFHSVPLDGAQIIGTCPNCGGDTRRAIFRIRYPIRWFIAGALRFLFLANVDFCHRDEFPT